MHFENMQFECAEGWTVDDPNTTLVDGEHQPLFSGSMALMKPQDIRQYIYILTPHPAPLIPIIYAPGTVIPLGRLDISWRSSFGEPGRLLTSMLSRRIPVPPPPTQSPASAVPPYLKRSMPPSRPQSPQLSQSRPGSPALHQPAPIPHTRPKSPFQALTPVSIPDLEVCLVIRDDLRRFVRVDEPFTILFSLVLSSSAASDRVQQGRHVSLAVQHLQPPRITAPSLGPTGPIPDAPNSRPTSSGYSTPTSMVIHSYDYSLANQKLLVAASPTQRQHTRDQDLLRTGGGEAVILPPPYFDGSDEHQARLNNVTFIGSSVLLLPPIEVSATSHPGEQKLTAIQEFELSYLPLRKGFTTVGGLRVLLIDDSFVRDAQHFEDFTRGEMHRRARTLKEWDVISEVWVAA